MPFQASVILDSIGPQGNRLTTIEFTLPKLWLAEFNTHCMFARNGASTRAIPFSKQLEMMNADPFVPHEWPLEQPGMAAEKNVEDPRQLNELCMVWHNARIAATAFAGRLRELGIHKQLAGRLLEPWRFQTTLVTGDADSYSNFFWQRRDKAAAPEIRIAADCIWDVYSHSTPQVLKAGEWHAPLLRPEDRFNSQEDALQVSAARCARLSYLTHHGVRDILEDFRLFGKLVNQGHWSPLEHVCQALGEEPWFKRQLCRRLNLAPTGHGKWPGWHQFRKNFKSEYRRNYVG